MNLRLRSLSLLVLGLCFAMAMLTPPGYAQTNASVDRSFDSSTDQPAFATALQPDGKILIGGSFGSVSGAVRYGVARLHSDGSLDTSFESHVDSTVQCIGVQPDGKILIGGDFNTVEGGTRTKLARLHPDGSLDLDFNPEVNGPVYSISVQPDGKILIGGTFRGVKRTVQPNLARLNADGTLDTSFNPEIDRTVRCIAVHDNGRILIGGAFTTIGGVSRGFLARLEANGALDTTFTQSTNANVNCIALYPNGMIIIGGSFTQVGGAACNRVARLLPGGALDSPNWNLNGEVTTLVLQTDGHILAGGSFTRVGNVTRNYVAKLYINGGADPSFDASTNGPVYSLAVQSDGKVVIAGGFTNLAGEAHLGIARFSPAAAIESFNELTSTRVRWYRSGTSPQASAVTFESSMDGGKTWTAARKGTRIGSEWVNETLNLPTHGTLRARAYTAGGNYGGSMGILETLKPFAFIPVPAVTTSAAGELTPNSANLSATVNPNGYETEVWFEYGTTTAYGQSTAPQTLESAEVQNVAVSQPATGLSKRTTYQFRVVARNAHGTVYGQNVTFTTPNSPPVAVDDILHVEAPRPGGKYYAVLDVLSNDFDPDGDTLKLSGVSQGDQGDQGDLGTPGGTRKITIAADGTLHYFPSSALFDGNDSFTYTISDPYGGRSTATVTLTNALPVEGDDQYHLPAGNEPQSLPVLVNDTDADSDVLKITKVTQGAKGTVTIDGDNVIYTPGESFEGVDSFTYTIDDKHGGIKTATVSLVNAAPVARADTVAVVRASRSINVLANDSDADGDTLTVSAVTNGAFGTVSNDGATVTYTPGAAFRNSDSFTYTATDGRGKSATATVTVVLERLVTDYVAAEKTPVAGAVEDTFFASFGTPSMNRRGELAFVARIKSPKGPLKEGVFVGSPAALLAQVGDVAPGIDGGVFRNFRHPALNDEGHVAFIASVSGTSKNANSGIWSTTSGKLALVAREGTEATGVVGSMFSRFDSFALPDTGRVVFVATLAKGVGSVTEQNDLGVWAEDEEGELRLVLREGDKVLIGEKERTVKTISAFAALSGSAGQRRSFNAEGDLLLRLGFMNGDKALVRVTAEGAFHEVAVEGDTTVELHDAKFDTFGLGTIRADGTVLFRARLKREKGVVSGHNDEAILAGTDSGDFRRLARTGDSVVNVPGVLLRSLKDPVGDANYGIAFIASLVPGRGGVTSKNDTAICLLGPAMLVQEGDEAPGADGRKFADFESLAYPDDRGVAFVASLTPKPGSANGAGERGLWAQDKDRVLHLLLLEGQKLQVNGVEKTLKKFAVLSAVPSSPSQGHSYSGNGGFAYRATFADGTEGVFTVWVP